MSQNKCILSLVLVKGEPISIKMCLHVLEETLNITMQKCPLHLIYVLTLSWKIWSDRLSCQCSTYVYILLNQSISAKTTGS